MPAIINPNIEHKLFIPYRVECRFNMHLMQQICKYDTKFGTD